MLMYTSNTGGNTFQVVAIVYGKAKMQKGSEDVEVNITEYPKSGDDELVEAEYQNTTENSSSFGDTMAGTENTTLNDVEVESPYSGGSVLKSVFSVYNGALPLRKKKLTDHWRKFIHPIMWRCTCVELQIKEFQSQALKYDRELAEYDQRKQFQFEGTTLEDFDSKSQPFSCQSRRNQIMMRKTRTRVEQTTDLPSYMSSHTLFSYHDKKTVVGCDELVLRGEWPYLEIRDGENSMGQMLSKIELVQSQVLKLKTRIDKIVSANSGKVSSSSTLSLLVPCDSLTKSDQDAASPPKCGNEMPDKSLYPNPQHISECKMGNLFMPGCINSSHGQATVPPDMIKSALPQGSTRQLDAIPPREAPKTDLQTKTAEPLGQPSISRSNVHNKKRKWGSQKSRSGRWKHRSLC